MANYILTEKKTIVYQDCVKDGIFLRWENDYGAIDQWLFEGNIKKDATIKELIIAEKFIDELSGVTANFEVIKKEYEAGISIFTSFEKCNLEGFLQLLRSKNIEMLIGTDYYKIDVQKKSLIWEKDKPFGKIELNIIPPKTYIK